VCVASSVPLVVEFVGLSPTAVRTGQRLVRRAGERDPRLLPGPKAPARSRSRFLDQRPRMVAWAGSCLSPQGSGKVALLRFLINANPDGCVGIPHPNPGGHPEAILTSTKDKTPGQHGLWTTFWGESERMGHSCTGQATTDLPDLLANAGRQAPATRAGATRPVPAKATPRPPSARP
jgi:hypothetical protein